MLKKLITSLLIILLSACNSEYGVNPVNSQDPKSSSKYNLLMVLDVVRHGDRGPVNWESDMRKVSRNLWSKDEIGILTHKGFEDSKALGKKFGELYFEELQLLPTNNYEDLVFIRSTDYQRTKATAQALTEGMFGKNNKIKMHVPDKRDDPAFASSHKNKPLRKKAHELLEKLVPENLKKALNVQLDYINNKYDAHYSIEDVASLGEIIYTGEIHNKPLPKHIDSARADEIKKLWKQLYLYRFSMPAENCIKSKDSLQEIVEFLDDKIKGHLKYKYILLSMHDTNMSSMLNMLGYSPDKPGYNANIKFKLLEKNGEYYVDVSYENQPLKLCKSMCSFNDLKMIIQNSIDTKCQDFTINKSYIKDKGLDK